MIRKKIIKSRKGFEVSPEFRDEKIIFHPIPTDFFHQLREGEEWWGKFGRERETGKRDCYGVPIYVQFFIPLKRHEEWEVKSDPYVSGSPPLPNETFGKAILKSGDKILREIKLSPNRWKFYFSQTSGVFAYPCFSFQGKEDKGIGRKFTLEVLEQFFPEEAKKEKEWLALREERILAWQKEYNVKRVLPTYWYKGKIIPDDLPKVGSFSFSTTVNADEMIHIIYSPSWRVIICEDTVILSGEETPESVAMFELACFYRYLKIMEAHQGFSVKPIESLKDFVESFKLFLKNLLREEPTEIEKIALEIKKYLFSNKKDDETLNNWANEVVFGV